MLKKFCHSFIELRWLISLVNALMPYSVMKLYVYIFKRLHVKHFDIFKNKQCNSRHNFQIFFSIMSDILLSTDRHIESIICICVSFLYSCLTSETLHYPWIPSSHIKGAKTNTKACWSWTDHPSSNQI